MVTVATIQDLPRMIPAAIEFYASSRALNNFDPARFEAVWTELLNGGSGVIFLAEDNGVHGAIGGAIHPEIYSGGLVAAEFFWFIQAGHRGEGVGLYRAFEAWARKRGCSEIRMVHLLDSMPEKLGRVYRHWGFEPVEVLYRKELM